MTRDKLTVEAITAQLHPDLFTPSTNAKFLAKCWRDIEKLRAVQEAWIDFFLTSGLDDIRPPDYMQTWWNDANITVYSDEIVDGIYKHEIDVEATKKQIARVIKWARGSGFDVKKDYSDTYFTVEVTTANGAKLEFKADRQVACKKVYVKTEVVPESTREVFEWECEHIAFTDIDTGDDE